MVADSSSLHVIGIALLFGDPSPPCLSVLFQSRVPSASFSQIASALYLSSPRVESFYLLYDPIRGSALAITKAEARMLCSSAACVLFRLFSDARSSSPPPSQERFLLNFCPSQGGGVYYVFPSPPLAYPAPPEMTARATPKELLVKGFFVFFFAGPTLIDPFPSTLRPKIPFFSFMAFYSVFLLASS